MPESDSIRAIWEEPLDFDFAVNGPPYLPEGTRGVRMASEGGGDHLSLFAWLHRGFAGIEKAELGVLVAVLRAAAIVHQTHHWQTRGGNFYGDHLLFERIYNDSVGFVDQVAERAVGSGSAGLVDPRTQTALVAGLVQTWIGKDMPTSFDMVTRSLKVVQCVVACIQLASSTLESKGQLSDGTENLLQGISDKHEEFVYLLQQRQGGRVASSYNRSASYSYGRTA